MDNFTEPHLPLISHRILFKQKVLPPRPTITQRLNLEQRIRRADRVRFSASAPRYRSKEPSSRNGSRASTPAPVSDTLSDLSELSEDEEDELEDDIEDKMDGVESSRFEKITKPPGAIGRKSGGFNLEEALKWEEGKYKRLITWINTKIKDQLDGEKSFKYQDQKTLKKLTEEGALKFSIEGLYDNNWPIREGFKMRLKTTSELSKRKGKGSTEKNLRKALAAVMSNP